MNKKYLLGTIPSLTFLLTMFVSSTFAWFTDFSVNQGNRVQSGNLSVGFSASETIEEGNLSGTIQDLKLDQSPLFNLGNAAQPGDSEEKYLRIRNEGNIAINYRVDFVVTIDSILAEVILFEIQPLGGSTVTIPGTQIDEGLFIALQDNDNDNGGLLKDTENLPSEFEIWRVKMYYTPSAGNTYNDASLQFEVDIKLNAWQFQNYEIDDFPLGLFEKQTQSMALGNNRSFRISNQFDLYAWGNNLEGRLGIGNKNETTSIHQVNFTNNNNENILNENEYPVKITSYTNQTFILTNQNRAFEFGAWRNFTTGSIRPTLIPTPNFESNEYFIDVQVGNTHSTGLTNLGKFYGWGNSTYFANQIPMPDRINYELEKIPTDIWQFTSKVDSSEKITKFSQGFNHTLAITTHNRVLALGDNRYLKLGTGSVSTAPSRYFSEVRTNFLPNEIPVEVFANTDASFIFTNFNRLFGFGDGTFGLLGNNLNTWSGEPVLIEVPGLSNGDSIRSVHVGQKNIFVITQMNKIFGWGLNSSYQVGINTNVNVLVPAEITGFTLNQNERIISIKSGPNHAFAITNMFRVFGWGGNAEYQLGNGTNTTVRTPQLIEF